MRRVPGALTAGGRIGGLAGVLIASGVLMTPAAAAWADGRINVSHDGSLSAQSATFKILVTTSGDVGSSSVLRLSQNLSEMCGNLASLRGANGGLNQANVQVTGASGTAGLSMTAAGDCQLVIQGDASRLIGNLLTVDVKLRQGVQPGAVVHSYLNVDQTAGGAPGSAPMTGYATLALTTLGASSAMVSPPGSNFATGGGGAGGQGALQAAATATPSPVATPSPTGDENIFRTVPPAYVPTQTGGPTGGAQGSVPGSTPAACSDAPANTGGIVGIDASHQLVPPCSPATGGASAVAPTAAPSTGGTGAAAAPTNNNGGASASTGGAEAAAPMAPAPAAETSTSGAVGNIVACASGMSPLIVSRNGIEAGRAMPQAGGQWVSVQGLEPGTYSVQSGDRTATVTVQAGSDQSASWSCTAASAGGAAGSAPSVEQANGAGTTAATGGASTSVNAQTAVTGGATGATSSEAVQTGAQAAAGGVSAGVTPSALPNTGDPFSVGALAALGGLLSGAGLVFRRRIGR